MKQALVDNLVLLNFFAILRIAHAECQRFGNVQLHRLGGN
jgi:hypothetical protein